MARAGRPAGKNPKPPINSVEPSRCPSCDSTERGPYFGKTTQEVKGTDGNGKPYDRIVRRRTRCASCGQTRIDRTFEQHGDAEALTAGADEGADGKAAA
jgi:hypothetical protein